MTTAVDTETVRAPSREDAPDVARRKWEIAGWRVVQVLAVKHGPVSSAIGLPSWTVTARIEMVR